MAIDPGNVQTAYTLIDTESLRPVSAAILPNDDVLSLIANHKEKAHTRFAIEMVASYGMPVGATVFDTVFWIGRFYEAAKGYRCLDRIYRMDVKMHLCHSSRAKDCNIHQALIDRFGVVGTKKNPGWFMDLKRIFGRHMPWELPMQMV